MAFNTGYVANEETLLQKHLQVQQDLCNITENQNIGGSSNVHLGLDPKRRRTESLLLFGNPDPSPIPAEGMSIGSGTKKLVVSTCRSIVKIETYFNKLEAKYQVLEQHRLNGIVPKDLLLPKKKPLFEDQQSHRAMNSLLALRITEFSRKMSKSRSQKTALEKDLLTTLQSSRDAQLKLLSADDEVNIALVNQSHSLNVLCFYSQLAVTREYPFLKMKRIAEKEAKKKSADTPMDTSPDARVMDILDQRS